MKNLNICLQRFYYEHLNALRLKKTIGILIIASVLIGMFTFTAINVGLIVAYKAWGGAILLTAIIALGLYLASS